MLDWITGMIFTQSNGAKARYIFRPRYVGHNLKTRVAFVASVIWMLAQMAAK